MPTYADLQLNRFYLVQENEHDELILVQPVLQTENCLLLVEHNEYETMHWRRKKDPVFDIADELTDEQLAEYENLVDPGNYDYDAEIAEEWEEEE